MQNNGNPGCNAELVLVCGDEQVHFELTSREVCRIGRTPDNTIRLSATNVSRNHAVVQAEDSSTFLILDLGSRNGTYVNGSRITSPTPLRNGDVISICGQLLLFIQVASQTPEQCDIFDVTVVERPLSEITLAVVDIREYTMLCQRVGEVRVAEIMQTFNTEAGTVLAGLNAWGVKYIGDAIMAIWVNWSPRTFLFTALRAVSAVMDIAASLQDRFLLESPVLLGAAVNVGKAAIGNMGSSAVADYTALGDAVNKAFRLEDCAGDLQVDLVLSSDVYKMLQPEIDPGKTMIAKNVPLKGYADSESVYTLDKSTLRNIVENLD